MSFRVKERDEIFAESITKDKLAFSVEEISEKTTLSKAFLRNEIRAKRLKAKMFGRRVLILLEDWIAYAENNKDWEPKTK